ncbi:Rieske 2Fe-2S domain-containing protein [Amycolatopsis sp. NPDC059090]|uniref:Rieske 2Fe-2S domain-containing protein n=1 Tax=unclassified Amycolatopsis TaxID=2618356 RepID=UPI003673027B
MYAGWYQAAFEHELHPGLTPVDLGPARIVLARTPDGLRAADAACPHRGAHLGHGGQLDGSAIVCPFHGKRIGIGEQAPGRYRVREHAVLGYGGLVFAGWETGDGGPFAELLDKLAVTHLFLPGFTLPARVRADLVIENAFDGTHFRPVHGIGEDPGLTLVPGDRDSLTARGVFVLPKSEWQRGGEKSVAVPFEATAYSPHVVVSRMGGDYPYVAITAATPRREGGCVIRFSLAVPLSAHEAMPAQRSEELYRYLLERSRAGVEQDLPIWENLIDVEPDYDNADRTVLAFRRFRDQFRSA